MNQWKIQTSLRVALLMVGFLALAANAQAESRLQALTVDEQGSIQLEVNGDGFDPLLNSCAVTGGYEIICRAEHVAMDEAARQSMDAFRAALIQRYPTITNVDVRELKEDTGDTVLLILTSRQKMQPQIRANTGKQIAIALIENHSPEKAPLKALGPKIAVKQASSKPIHKVVEPVKKPDVAPVIPISPENDKTLGTVELNLDARLALRQKQQDAQRELIKAQEQQWESQTSTPEPTSALALSQKITLKPAPVLVPAPEPVKKQPQNVSRNAVPMPVEDAEPVAPVKLSTPSSVWVKSQGEAQSIYRNPPAQSISNASFYALLDDANVDSTVRTAIQQALSGQRQQAIDLLQPYAQSHPEPSVRYTLAMILLSDSKDKTQGQSILQDVIQNAPYLPAYWTLIDQYLDDNRVEEADTLLSKAALLAPDDSMLLFLRGRLAEKQQNWSAARTVYHQALAQSPGLLEVHYRLAQVALKSKNWNEAEWELLQHLQLVPDDSRALKLLAFIAQQRQQPEQAIALYQQALQPDVLINLAHLFASQKQTQKALSLLNAVQSLADNNPDLLFNVGMSYAELKASNHARTTLERFIALRKLQNADDPRLAQAKTTLSQLRR